MLSSSTVENYNNWKTITSKNKKKKKKKKKESRKVPNKRNDKMVTGSRKIVGGSLMAATRTANVFYR